MAITSPARYRIENLPERIQRKIVVDPLSGCWVWQGRLDKSGYGQLKWNRKVVRLHRVAWALLVGPVPPGHQVNHVRGRGCRSKACCWPEHLEAVQSGYGQGLPADICDHASPEAVYTSAQPALAPTIEVHVHLHYGT
jgi:hypothetical protein